MKIESAQVGLLGTNFYVITDEKTGVSAAVDPGSDYSEIGSLVKDKNIKYILLTHGHFDHIFGVAELKKQTGAQIVIGELDAENLYNAERNSAGMRLPFKVEPTEADVIVKEGDELSVGNIKINVIETPGHTEGSVCYILPEEKVIFSGDTLFYHSIGRTDFSTSVPEKMNASLKKLASLDGNFEVFTGHGDSTDLDEERLNNYFLR
ncbi:MAG: MBL fold metallo-hydrolase [Clostridia bacterium]|nr:MBL fold metallo-hydrolase [Clostridia bacterium]